MKHLFSEQLRTVTIRLVDNADDEAKLNALENVLAKGQKFIVAYADTYYETAITDGTKKFSELSKLLGSEGGSVSVAWADVTGKPATFPPTIGTSATTAKAGNYAPAWSEVTSKPTTFAPTIGTTATTAAAGNHTHTASVITATPISPGTATNVQGILAELAARITTLETP